MKMVLLPWLPASTAAPSLPFCFLTAGFFSSSSCTNVREQKRVGDQQQQQEQQQVVGQNSDDVTECRLALDREVGKVASMYA